MARVVLLTISGGRDFGARDLHELTATGPDTSTFLDG
jgi:hypothetical protein